MRDKPMPDSAITDKQLLRRALIGISAFIAGTGLLALAVNVLAG